MHGGVDIVGQQADDAEALLTGTNFSTDPAMDLERRERAYAAAIARQEARVSQLAYPAGSAIFTRDFRVKHDKARLRMAKALLEPSAAAEAEKAIGFQAVKAGCFPSCAPVCGLSMRPSLKGINQEGLRILLDSLRNVKKAEQLL